MLTPVALATWIAFCIPSADPDIATALVMAGSGGEPMLVTNKRGQPVPAAQLGESPTEELYVGLTQIPASQLRAQGIAPEVALNSCANLAIGWSLWSNAHARAQAQQPTKWKAISFAFSLYRDQAMVLETPYSKKATDMALAYKPVAPAPFGSRLYYEVAAAWANGSALLARLESPGSSLGQSQAISAFTRGTARD